MKYQFECLPEERESTIVIDHHANEIFVYTSHNAVASRLHKRFGYPYKKDDFGAIWQLEMNDITKLPGGVFKTTKT